MKLICKIFGHWKKTRNTDMYRIIECRFCNKIFKKQTWKEVAIEFGEAIRKSNEMFHASFFKDGGFTE